MKKEFFCLCLCFVLCLLGSGPLYAADSVSGQVIGKDPAAAVSVSSLSPEEKKWYQTFMKGTMFFDGWETISKEILESTPARFREEQKRRLAVLGHKIGVEWSRDNRIRRVDNRMLKEWGRMLKKAAKQSPEQLPEVIASIDEQVSEILN